MKLSSKAIIVATTAATVLAFATPAFAETTMPNAMGGSSANHTMMMQRTMARRVTAMQKMLTRNMNAAVTNWQKVDANLNKRMSAKQAKGFDVSAAQAPIADLESQISTVQGLVGQVSSMTDLASLKSLQTQFQASRKAALKDVAAANKALAKARKPKMQVQQ